MAGGIELLPQRQQAGLRLIEWIGGRKSWKRIGIGLFGKAFNREDGFEAIPEGLRREAFGRELPDGRENGLFKP